MIYKGNVLELSIHSRTLESKPYFGEYFTYMADRHNHNTRGALRKLVNVPISKTTFYGTQSITAKSVNDWNSLQNQIAFPFENDHVITPKS